jgi:hypothetical protein
MLDLGKSKNDNSDSDAEYSNQLKISSSEKDDVKRMNSVPAIKVDELKFNGTSKANTVIKPMNDDDFFNFDMPNT